MQQKWQDHDACGVGFIAQLGGAASREVVERALLALQRLNHRGGVDADGCSGDGAGLLTALPHAFFRAAAVAQGVQLPERFAVGMLFLPNDQLAAAQAAVEAAVRASDLHFLGWREVPLEPRHLGPRSAMTLPLIYQCFAAAKDPSADLERLLFLARKRVEATAPAETYICSFSERTIVYKGLLVPWQLSAFYPDLANPGFVSNFAVFHQRYSTNTSPSWRLAQPFRMVGHNGEINTIGSNRRWARARQHQLRQEFRAPEWFKALEENVSDSASLDNALEILIRQGYSPAAAMYRLMPPAWEHDDSLPAGLRVYLEAEARDQEPWDGPAAVIFSDGRMVGAKLDRNGLRPMRYTVTADGLVVVGSEVGIADFGDKRIVERNRLGPGELVLADPQGGHFYRPHEISELLGLGGQGNAAVRYVPMPVVEPGVHFGHIAPDDAANAEIPEDIAGIANAQTVSGPSTPNLMQVASAAGFTQDQYKLLFKPLIESGKDATFSMGDDAPPAYLSGQQRLIWDYCKQRFAQVTNPPIDSLREAHVMSLDAYLGGSPVKLNSPLLDQSQFERLPALSGKVAHFIPLDFEAKGGVVAARAALDRIQQTVRALNSQQPGLVVLTDRGISATRAALPVLLAAALAWKTLVEEQAHHMPLVVETAQVWDTHHFAMLAAVGVTAIHPYVAWEMTARISAHGPDHFRYGVEAGLRKVLAKMGISTLASYRNSHLFETVGLNNEVVEQFFEGASAHLSGVSLDQLLQEAIARHEAAFAPAEARTVSNEPVDINQLRDAGLYRYRHGGEQHSTSPDLVRRFHAYVKAPTPEKYREYANYVNSRPAVAIRDLFQFRHASLPPTGDIESASSIMRRFCTQAMSLGAISREAQRALSVAMNRIGGRSNTGEGGEDSDNYTIDLEANNKIKQVASARFGVTAQYLVHAEELEIKMAQGAKPGEGGQLPPAKVSPYIARLRHAVPGMALISPPPHHDIYSIEDLAQLIHDLKAINPSARVGVKLVAGAGVGIIAAGVAKAGADVITIAGFDGGTGASPLTSIKNTGLPWEIGLRDAHNMLVRCGFRSRVRLRVDGGFKSGRDVVIGALLGADEFGFGTSALVAVGCVMVRQCHLNTCPTGIATQDERLRQKFAGTPEMLIAYFEGVAQEVRELLSQLGARSIEDIVGRVDLLEPRDPGDAEKIGDLLDTLPELRHPLRCLFTERPTLQQRLVEVLDRAEKTGHVQAVLPIGNSDRSVGARLTGEVLRRFGQNGIAPGTFEYEFRGSAGQSFGAFLGRGIRFVLKGEANDYVGKCMSGGEIIISAGSEASRRGDVVLGNTALYGATSGQLYAAGRAGERFAVRNSGALAVVEGTGQHGCEYMTAGLVVVLGPTGANFGSGMTGGLSYVLRDHLPQFRFHDEYVKVEAISEAEEEHLREVLETHFRLTESQRASRLLSTAGALPLVRVQPLKLPCSIEATWASVLPSAADRLAAESASSVDATAATV